MNIFNLCLVENYSPNRLKDGDISTIFKKNDALCKKNFRPITVLPLASKTFERLSYDELMPFTENFISPKYSLVDSWFRLPLLILAIVNGQL